MTTFDNPFSIDRAEQLGDNLFEFYANHKNFEGLLKRKSLVIEGGRGSGKTMYFLYNSFTSKRNEAKSKNILFKDFFKQEDFIGIYFRADSNFVPAFQHKGLDEDDWIQLFSHYVNIALSKRLVEVVIDVIKGFENDQLTIDIPLPEQIEAFFPGQNIQSYSELLKAVNREEILLINYINNVSRVERPNVFANGFLINTIASTFLKPSEMIGKSVHVFIDEYENMLPYQQKIFNTLIKHPNPVIFNIGMRNNGFKTFNTLAETEIISAPHDYSYFNFEKFTNTEYEELIVDICKKRLSKIEELSTREAIFTDIRYYLGEYNIEQELNHINNDLYNQLLAKLKARVGDSNSWEILKNTEDPIALRLHIVLLDRGNSLEEISKEYQNYLDKKQSKYINWLHNNRNGIIYLLCKEYRKDKLYFGFSVYRMLSSGIIRYFIELCEIAFKQAYRNGFDFRKPRVLTLEEQTIAADYVSQYKVNDIETFTPYGHLLKRFVLLLGQIFMKLHQDPKQSEPEKNHFSTDFDRLNKQTKDIINNSILYSVLQRKDETKEKKSLINTNSFEYHLNHIYAPYFKISPRKIRSLAIKPDNLDTLICGDIVNATEVANSIVKDKTIDNQDQLKFNFL